MKMKRRFLGILLSLVMVLGLMPGMSLTAHAEQPEVRYLDANGAEQTCTAYTVLDANTTNWSDSWYVVNSTTVINEGIDFTNSNVHLILCDGASLTSSSYLENEYGNLTIYGQSSGSGTLALQGGSSIYAEYNVTINGGTLNLSGTHAGIYADYDGITINNGTVKAEGGRYGGLYAYERDIIINGGSVEAASAQSSGIFTDWGNVIINGGTVEATGVTYGIGARKYETDGIGKVIINGGAVQAIASGDDGCGVFSEANDVTIGEETASFIAAGKKGAFTEGVNVKNAIPGIGWTNTAGTEGKAEIAISTEGQTLTYKKVRFPAAVAVVTTAPKANTLTYNGSAQELVTAGVASGGEMQYALGTDGTTTPTDGWSTTIPSKTDAGSYYVWYKAVGDSDHRDSTPVAVPVTISKAGINVIAEPRSKTYGETDPVLTYVSDSLATGDSFYGKLEREAGEDAGTYQIKQGTLSAGDNYEITYVPADFTINKADISPSVSLDGWEEGSGPNSPSVSGNPGGGEPSYLYKANDADDSAYSTEVPKEPGQYTVKAIVPETDNYKGGEAEQDFTITKKVEPAHVHNLAKTEEVPATCETEGTEAYWTCSDCFKLFSDAQGSQEITKPVTIPALGHDWGEWTVTTPATCEKSGEETRNCQNDDSHRETRTVPALGHDWGEWTVTTSATCEKDGEETRTCQNDDSHRETRAIPATGHDWGEWIVTKEPTLSQDGERYRVCRHDDSHIQTEVIPNLSYERLSGDHSLTDPRFSSDGETPVEPQDPEDPAPVDPADPEAPTDPEEPVHNCPSAYFVDVDTSLWYHEAIDYVIENELMNGFPGNEFRPDATLSRAMLATILYRLEGSPAVTGENPFTDVEADQWYTDAVIWASENGIVEGYGNNDFRPQRDVNRQEMAAMMMRYAEYKGVDVSVGEDTNLLDFNDAEDVSDWAVEAMQWAVGSGLIQGKNGGRLDPTGDTTRAQAATILMRFCENVLK